MANLPLNFFPWTNVLYFSLCNENDNEHSSWYCVWLLIKHGYTEIIAVHMGIFMHSDFGKMARWSECPGHNSYVWAA